MPKKSANNKSKKTNLRKKYSYKGGKNKRSKGKKGKRTYKKYKGGKSCAKYMFSSDQNTKSALQGARGTSPTPEQTNYSLYLNKLENQENCEEEEPLTFDQWKSEQLNNSNTASSNTARRASVSTAPPSASTELVVHNNAPIETALVVPTEEQKQQSKKAYKCGKDNVDALFWSEENAILNAVNKSIGTGRSEEGSKLSLNVVDYNKDACKRKDFIGKEFCSKSGNYVAPRNNYEWRHTEVPLEDACARENAREKYWVDKAAKKELGSTFMGALSRNVGNARNYLNGNEQTKPATQQEIDAEANILKDQQINDDAARRKVDAVNKKKAFELRKKAECTNEDGKEWTPNKGEDECAYSARCDEYQPAGFNTIGVKLRQAECASGIDIGKAAQAVGSSASSAATNLGSKVAAATRKINGDFKDGDVGKCYSITNVNDPKIIPSTETVQEEKEVESTNIFGWPTKKKITEDVEKKVCPEGYELIEDKNQPVIQSDKGSNKRLRQKDLSRVVEEDKPHQFCTPEQFFEAFPKLMIQKNGIVKEKAIDEGGNDIYTDVTKPIIHNDIKEQINFIKGLLDDNNLMEEFQDKYSNFVNSYNDKMSNQDSEYNIANDKEFWRSYEITNDHGKQLRTCYRFVGSTELFDDVLSLEMIQVNSQIEQDKNRVVCPGNSARKQVAFPTKIVASFYLTHGEKFLLDKGIKDVLNNGTVNVKAGVNGTDVAWARKCGAENAIGNLFGDVFGSTFSGGITKKRSSKRRTTKKRISIKKNKGKKGKGKGKKTRRGKK